MGDWDWGLWAAVVACVAVTAHLGAILAVPYLMTGLLKRKLLKRVGGNALVILPPSSPAQRVVPIPSPDLRYGIGFFDVSRGPLRITAPLTGGYVSLSLYARNMDNFYAVNDRQADDGRFDVILVGPNATVSAADGAKVVRSPSETGVVVLRAFTGEGEQARQVAERLGEARCGPVS